MSDKIRYESVVGPSGIKNLIFILTTVISILLPSISGATSILFQDNFNNGTYIDASEIYSTAGFLATPWSVENGVLMTGSSTLHRDVHYQHFVDVRYFSTESINNISISLDYLNTRICGGNLAVVLGQKDLNGQTIWADNYIYVGWMQWSGNARDPDPAALANRDWMHLELSNELLNNQSQGRPVNMIYIRELDITDEEGTGYIDNIVIRGALASNNPAPEPATMFLFGLGILGIVGVRRKKSA